MAKSGFIHGQAEHPSAARNSRRSQHEETISVVAREAVLLPHPANELEVVAVGQHTREIAMGGKVITCDESLSIPTSSPLHPDL